jgi:hypothetical protein
MIAYIKLIYEHLLLFLFGPSLIIPDEFDAATTAEDWEAYLKRLSNRSYGQDVIDFWNNIKQYGLGIPQAGPIEDSGLGDEPCVFQFSWYVNEHHLEVDILENGGFDWWWHNGKTYQSDGDTQRSVNDKFSEHFVSRLGTMKEE